MPPGRAPAPLGLASPTSALFEREVGDGLSTGPCLSATRWAGPSRLSGDGPGVNPFPPREGVLAGSRFCRRPSAARLSHWAGPVAIMRHVHALGKP